MIKDPISPAAAAAAWLPIDREFADLLTRLAGAGDDRETDPLWRAAAAVSRATREGHICIDLADLVRADPVQTEPAAVPPLSGPEGPRGIPAATRPDPARWRDRLLASGLVGPPGDYKPLVLDAQNRLYLYRCWLDQDRLLNWLNRCSAAPPPAEPPQRVREALDRLFPATDPAAFDWQKTAAALAWLKRFCVISGGPGTGKTTTVARILALFLLLSGRRPAVKLAAPTGKAAARLQNAIRQAKRSLEIPAEVKALIPEEAATVHRLLGLGGRPGGTSRQAPPTLAADLVVVDEASMVDLALLSRLVQALPPQAALILLGDKDQLASVEAGAVLGDLCAAPDLGAFSPAFRPLLETCTGQQLPATTVASSPAPLLDHLVELKKNYRFAEDSGIGAVSAAVRRGDGRRAVALLADSRDPSIDRRDPPPLERFADDLLEALDPDLPDYFAAADPAALFRAFNRFRVLCALRHGPIGAEALNEALRQALVRRGRIPGGWIWYPRRPVLITRNDYRLRLFNGDIGIAWAQPGAEEPLCVYFEAPDGTYRAVHPLRLPEHETVFAMTVHKSQGSEFDRVHLVLPDQPSPVVTRELIYTGITRARRRVTLWSTEEALRRGVEKTVLRRSGLRNALWGGEEGEG